jgi:hypothetical protein
MNATQWARSRSPEQMLAHLHSVNANERKVRLYICACWRVRAPLVRTTEEILAEIEAVETDRHRKLKQGYFPTYRDYWDAARSTQQVHERWGRSSESELCVPAAEQADLLRELFGNPFRPVAFDPAWRTDTAVTLARQMYDSRDFGAMPILADALQDAGCEDEAILLHCREPGAHVRGCWVCDLVLGFA